MKLREAKDVAYDYDFEYREEFSKYTHQDPTAAVQVEDLSDIVTVAQECPSASAVEGVAMSYLVY